NGYWARSRAEAEQVCHDLDACGVNKVAVSYDRYHDRIVGADTLDTLLRAASQAQLTTQVQYCGERDDDAYRTATEVTDRHGAELTTAEVLPFGRGRNIAATPETDVDAVPDAPCGVAVRPVLTPEGELFTCCGPARDASPSSPLRLPADTAN